MRNLFNNHKSKIKYSPIDIINSEGGILKVECINSSELLFKIVDQHKMSVAFFNKEELIQYLDGVTYLRDSEGDQWNVINSSSMFTGKQFILDELKSQGIDLN